MNLLINLYLLIYKELCYFKVNMCMYLMKKAIDRYFVLVKLSNEH